MRVLCSVFVLIMFVCGAAQDASAQVTRVLFIGNSLTTSHDIPAMIKGFADANGRDVEYVVHAPGGATFEDHVENPKIAEILRGQRFDYVVLQGQSQRSAFVETQRVRDVYVPAARMVETIRAINPETKIVFYQTMARKKGDPKNARSVRALRSYAGMQERVNEAYAYMAQKNDAILAPIGSIWWDVRYLHPKIDLYSDDVHPSEIGAYLAACTLFMTMFDTQCQGGLSGGFTSDITSKIGLKGHRRLIRDVIEEELSQKKVK